MARGIDILYVVLLSAFLVSWWSVGSADPLALASCRNGLADLVCTDMGNVTSFSLENYTDPEGLHAHFYMSGFGPGDSRTTVMHSLPERAFRGLNVSMEYIYITVEGAASIAEWSYHCTCPAIAH